MSSNMSVMATRSWYRSRSIDPDPSTRECAGYAELSQSASMLILRIQKQIVPRSFDFVSTRHKSLARPGRDAF